MLAKYQEAALKSDMKRGRDQKNCATCHPHRRRGILVGPDISDTLSKTPATLLNDILDPNSAIDSNYVAYAVTTRTGKVLTGIIAGETASSLTLKRAESDNLLRQDIEEIVSSGLSLMPEGMEKQITVAEMADLLAFLRAGGTPRRHAVRQVTLAEEEELTTEDTEEHRGKKRREEEKNREGKSSILGAMPTLAWACGVPPTGPVFARVLALHGHTQPWPWHPDCPSAPTFSACPRSRGHAAFHRPASFSLASSHYMATHSRGLGLQRLLDPRYDLLEAAGVELAMHSVALSG
ncbi:MAG: c-type cytochrome [Gemmataceae bacterium]